MSIKKYEVLLQTADLGNAGDVIKGEYSALLWTIEKDAN